MTDCLIAFGGNLSNPKLTFQMALSDLCGEGFTLKGKSGLWRSPAWPPGSEQPEYKNAVVLGRFDGDAHECLTLLQRIEEKHGRVRSVANAARTLDLDLLTFGSQTYKTERLTLPHPRMLERAFVLIPAAELQRKWIKNVQRLPKADIHATRYDGAW